MSEKTNLVTDGFELQGIPEDQLKKARHLISELLALYPTEAENLGADVHLLGGEVNNFTFVIVPAAAIGSEEERARKIKLHKELKELFVTTPLAAIYPDFNASEDLNPKK